MNDTAEQDCQFTPEEMAMAIEMLTQVLRGEIGDAREFLQEYSELGITLMKKSQQQEKVRNERFKRIENGVNECMAKLQLLENHVMYAPGSERALAGEAHFYATAPAEELEAAAAAKAKKQQRKKRIITKRK